jgi:putative transposase
MARPLRIEYPGAWYHVMNRGANRKFIFNSDEHRKLFLTLLEEVVKLYSVEIHSYCLMGNHYHLLMKTPFANLGKAMQFLNGVYTQKFNQLEKRDGGLFRGRYKAILIQDDYYLMHVSRYIHLNPFVAKLCDSPEKYRWSSYLVYLHQEACSFVTTEVIVEAIGNKENYKSFVDQGIDEELNKFYGQEIIPTVLGDETFKKISLKKINAEHIEGARPDVKRITMLPEMAQIIDLVTLVYGAKEEDVMVKGRQKNIPRMAAVYLSKMIGKYSYPIIAAHFDATVDAVRNIVRRHSHNFVNDVNIQSIVTMLANGRL